MTNNNILIRKNLLPLRYFHNPIAPFEILIENQKKQISDFINLIESKKIHFETVPCLCGNKEFDLIASVDRYSLPQQTVICTTCGLVQSNPRMDEKSCELFYSTNIYREIYTPENNALYFEENYYSNDFGRHIYDDIVKNHRKICKKMSVLEFGAGGGWNLIPFIQAGASVTGIDYDSNLVRIGIEHGINMIQGGFEIIDDEYDIIILNHVLEHFLDPISSLKKLIQYLKDDGLIYIGVPNIMNFSMGQLQNAHNYYFTPKLFINYLDRAGLKCLQFGEAQNYHMYGLFQKDLADNKNLEISTTYNQFVKILNKHKRRIYFVEFLKMVHLFRPLRKIYKDYFSYD